MTKPDDNPFFSQFEKHYSDDPQALRTQVESDRKLMDRVMAILSNSAHSGAASSLGNKR